MASTSNLGQKSRKRCCLLETLEYVHDTADDHHVLVTCTYLFGRFLISVRKKWLI